MLGDLVEAILHGKVTAVERVPLCVGKVAKVGPATFRGEEDVALAPQDERGGPLLPKKGLPLRVDPFDRSTFETQRRNILDGTTLRGFAISPSQVSAPASVIRSPQHFS
jgi:hypothetical protein